MWFAENPLKIDIRINIKIEIFDIILFLYFPEKLFCKTKKNQIKFSDDFVIIFLLATITDNCEKYTFPFANQT